MALIGGGGAGNVAGGSNPTGTGGGLNYIGKHAYAYSGDVGIPSTTTSMLDFTTAFNSYIDATIEFHGDLEGVGNSSTVFLIEIDGQTVSKNEWNATVDSNLLDAPTRLILAGGSRVRVRMAQAAGGSINFQATMTGEVYYA